MNTVNDYKSIYKNTGTTPRTMGEAYKNADYATPIWRCETETESGWRFMVEAMIGFFIVGLIVGGLIALVYWAGLL